MSKIIRIQYNGEIGYNSNIRDVLQFVFKVHKITFEEFLTFQYKDISNNDRILSAYTEKEKIKYGFIDEQGKELKDSSSITLEMRCPYTSFFIDSDYITHSIINSNSNLLYSDFNHYDNYGNMDLYNKNKFFEEKVNFIKDIKKTTPYQDKDIKNSDFKTRKQYLNPRVWIWCKSLCENGVFNDNSIFDLTPFIRNIESSNTETGGQFSLSLINIEGFMQSSGDSENSETGNGVWMPKKNRYLKFKGKDKFYYLFKNIINARYEKDGYIYTNNDVRVEEKIYFEESNTELENLVINVKKENKIEYISSDFFFKNLISENDIVFITYRDDEENEVETTDDFFINNSNLPNKSWEMIGLVDKNSIGVTYENSESVVNVSGRDLMKLLIEDGSYFFANSYSDDDSSGIFQNIDLPKRGDGVNATNQVINKGQNSANRLAMTGMLESSFIQETRNVHYVMNMLISTLSNIEICPSKLFEYYGDNRTKFQIPILETVKKTEEESKENSYKDVDL